MNPQAEPPESTSRRLATIQVIKSLSPIPGADKIERADLLGWQCVVKKDEFKVGELVVYCEVDSILPLKPWSDFLKNKDKPDKPIRIRTIKLKGQVSQGICFPLSIIENLQIPAVENMDVTAEIGVTKYEPPATASAGLPKGWRPPYVPKTDEERIQNIPHILEKYRGVHCFITEKVDGQSFSAYINKEGVFGVCSRNLDIMDTPESGFWAMAREMKLEEKLRSIGKPVVLQGEFIGPGIQGNKLKLVEKTVAIFNFFDINELRYYNLEEVETTLRALQLRPVPMLGELTIGTLHPGCHNNFSTVEDFVKASTRRSMLNQEVWAEGVVIRPIKEIRDEKLGRLSFKVINPEFQLTYKDA